MGSTEKVGKLSERLYPAGEEQDSTAAVAIVMKQGRKDLEILFVKRVVNPKDPWSGQMAFPGGKRSENDKTLKETLMRETFEEVNIDLGTSQILGVLKALVSLPRPDMKILPFIVLLKDEPEIKLNEEELEDFVWISLRDLLKNKGKVTFPFGEFPAFIVGTYTIWGLTYRILEELLCIMNED